MTRLSVKRDEVTGLHALYLGDKIYKEFPTEGEAHEFRKKLEGTFVSDARELSRGVSRMDMSKDLEVKLLGAIDRYILERGGMDREGVLELIQICVDKTNQVVKDYLNKEEE